MSKKGGMGGGVYPSFGFKKKSGSQVASHWLPLSIIYCCKSHVIHFSNMAAVQANPQEDALQDLTNFPDTWNSIVLEESGTVPEWKVNMLSLRRYHRVKFKHRNTIHTFLDYVKIIADHKEDEQYPMYKLTIMRRIMTDITNWIIERRAYCIDDSHWPIDEHHVSTYRAIYATYIDWVDERYMIAGGYFATVFEQKRLVEDAFSDSKEEE